jgi:hypothetical protein
MPGAAALGSILFLMKYPVWLIVEAGSEPIEQRYPRISEIKRRKDDGDYQDQTYVIPNIRLY